MGKATRRILWLAAALAWPGLVTGAAAAEVVAEGVWQKVDYAVAGSWRIVRDGGTYTVVLDDDFETKNGPDLHILLSPRPLAELTDETAGDGALVVGLLKTSDTALLFKKMKGAQSLELPPGTDPGAYRTILIHCVRFSHLWAGAPL